MSTETAVPFAFATTSHMSTALRVEIITEFDDLTRLEAEWTQLWNNSPSATIFQSLPWQRAWWKAFGGGVQLCAPVIWRGNQLVGVLPVIRNRAAIRFLGTPG
ncbi:MAG: hypothetical protein JRN15_09200, partial [Nitrososphaerota archaeon]|nr:hypothetical protein [Nitrososphaerota archaeon]